MTEQRVSDDDIDTAISRVAEAIQGPAYGKASIEKAGRAVAAVIALDWGPKPTVSQAQIDNRSHACPRCPEGDEVWVLHPEHVIDLLRECGIEVTNG